MNQLPIEEVKKVIKETVKDFACMVNGKSHPSKREQALTQVLKMIEDREQLKKDYLTLHGQLIDALYENTKLRKEVEHYKVNTGWGKCQELQAENTKLKEEIEFITKECHTAKDELSQMTCNAEKERLEKERLKDRVNILEKTFLKNVGIGTKQRNEISRLKGLLDIANDLATAVFLLINSMKPDRY